MSALAFFTPDAHFTFVPGAPCGFRLRRRPDQFYFNIMFFFFFLFFIDLVIKGFSWGFRHRYFMSQRWNYQLNFGNTLAGSKSICTFAAVIGDSDC